MKMSFTAQNASNSYNHSYNLVACYLQITFTNTYMVVNLKYTDQFFVTCTSNAEVFKVVTVRNPFVVGVQNR